MPGPLESDRFYKHYVTDSYPLKARHREQKDDKIKIHLVVATIKTTIRFRLV